MLPPKVISVAIVYGGMLWTGYQRRRGIWTRRSWILFGGSLLLTFVLIGIVLLMARGVDNGIYHGMSEGRRKAYFLTMLGLAVSSILASVSLALSFARGNRHQQFGFSSHRHEPGPSTLLQIDLRDRLHQAMSAAEFTLTAERNNPESYGGWQRDYVRGGQVIRVCWNEETWQFILDDGKSFRRLAARSPGDLTGAGLAEFVACIDRT